MDESTYANAMLWVAQAFEIVAAAVLVLGLLLAFVLAARAYRRTGDGAAAYRTLRQPFGGVHPARPGDPRRRATSSARSPSSPLWTTSSCWA